MLCSWVLVFGSVLAYESNGSWLGNENKWIILNLTVVLYLISSNRVDFMWPSNIFQMEIIPLKIDIVRNCLSDIVCKYRLHYLLDILLIWAGNDYHHLDFGYFLLTGPVSNLMTLTHTISSSDIKNSIFSFTSTSYYDTTHNSKKVQEKRISL